MIKRYKGRVVVPGDVLAQALVTHTGFNTLANLKTAGSFLNPTGVLQDMNNPALYGKRIPGKILCLVSEKTKPPFEKAAFRMLIS